MWFQIPLFSVGMHVKNIKLFMFYSLFMLFVFDLLCTWPQAKDMQQGCFGVLFRIFFLLLFSLSSFSLDRYDQRTVCFFPLYVPSTIDDPFSQDDPIYALWVDELLDWWLLDVYDLSHSWIFLESYTHLLLEQPNSAFSCSKCQTDRGWSCRSHFPEILTTHRILSSRIAF